MSILTHRPRRMRKHEFNRSLIRENSLSVSDLIYPLFIIEGEKKKEKIGKKKNSGNLPFSFG